MRPTIVTMERILLSVMACDAIPIQININENSLICASDVPAKKLFFLVCFISPSMIIMIRGFAINTNRLKIITIGNTLHMFAKST